MATTRITLHPMGALPVDSTDAMPEIKVAGTNAQIMSLSYDAAADEAAMWIIPYTPVTGGGNITVKVRWYADTATTGDVVWGGSVLAYTPETDSGDIEADSWATEVTATDSHLGTTAQRIHEAVITVTNLDSYATGDFLCIRVRRDADNGSDTMASDAQVVGVVVEYADS